MESLSPLDVLKPSDFLTPGDLLIGDTGLFSHDIDGVVGMIKELLWDDPFDEYPHEYNIVYKIFYPKSGNFYNRVTHHSIKLFVEKGVKIIRARSKK